MGIQPVLKHKPKCHIKCFPISSHGMAGFIIITPQFVVKNHRFFETNVDLPWFSQAFSRPSRCHPLPSGWVASGGIPSWNPMATLTPRWECPGLAGQSHHLPRSNWYQLFWWLRCSSFTILGKAYPENLEFYPIATIGSILLGCASKCTGCCGYPKDAAFVFVKRVLQAPQIPMFIKSMGISGS